MTDIGRAIQKMLDEHSDGWSLAQHCIVMALERVKDGRIESTTWYWCPADQPDWMTDALLEAAMRQREAMCDDDDD